MVSEFIFACESLFLSSDDHEVKLDAQNLRRPPLRRGRRHHGGFAMKPCLDAEPAVRRGTLHAE